MPIQIANPVVVAKIERLAVASGLSKTAAVEKAVDALLERQPAPAGHDTMARFNALLAQLDRVPDQTMPNDVMEWDEHGLPR